MHTAVALRRTAAVMLCTASLVGAPARASASEVTCSGPHTPSGGMTFTDHMIFADDGAALDPNGGVLTIGTLPWATARLVYDPPRRLAGVHVGFRALTPERRALYRYLPADALASADFIVSILSEGWSLDFAGLAWLKLSADQAAGLPSLTATLVASDAPSPQVLDVVTESGFTKIALPLPLPVCSAILLKRRDTG
jgi:hypothetical protein